ncbi:hypothetical protein AB0M95_03685 [Sphaerisporangium sp. NPDC051017]|uniref:hypothetical protein n=1 Tax=Sphaerisporangium sp. NPDC051017 TaxID=3154636 RepID=UPI003418C8B8
MRTDPGPLALEPGGVSRRTGGTGDDLAVWTRRALAEVEDLLASALHSPGDPFLTSVATHLLGAGGKRLRPRIALLAATFGDPDRPGVIRAAPASSAGRSAKSPARRTPPARTSTREAASRSRTPPCETAVRGDVAAWGTGTLSGTT